MSDVAAAHGEVVREIRDDMLIRPYRLINELGFGAPRLRPCTHRDDADEDCTDTIICPCGDEHDVTPTAYGIRAFCDELDVMWTSLRSESILAGDREIRQWVAEPYTPMKRRGTA